VTAVVLQRLADRVFRIGIPVLPARPRPANGLLVLAYHNVIPDEGPLFGDQSLHMRRGRFAAHLDLLAATCDVVPLEEALGRGASPSGRPRVAITFDDAYHGAVTLGVAELKARRLPATIFVAPAFVGGGEFWWDALAPRDGASLPAEMRSRALEEGRGLDADVRALAQASGWRTASVPPMARCASRVELEQALDHPALVLGSHSWAHPNLRRLNEDEVREDLARALSWLRSGFGRVCGTLSYPYGLADASIGAVARSVGHSAGLLIKGGWSDPGTDPPFGLPRLNIPAGLGERSLALRLAGWRC
jgi:peptidoglycan/xylan/chitin deacetylase (PgdA/CDA1 family)